MSHVALSTAHAVGCAHCRRRIMHAGVVGPWVLRPCSDRRCREANDGGWNLITRAGDLAVSVPLSRRVAEVLVRHLSDQSPLSIQTMAAAADLLWVGPQEEARG